MSAVGICRLELTNLHSIDKVEPDYNWKLRTQSVTAVVSANLLHNHRLPQQILRSYGDRHRHLSLNVGIRLHKTINLQTDISMGILQDTTKVIPKQTENFE